MISCQRSFIRSEYQRLNRCASSGVQRTKPVAPAVSGSVHRHGTSFPLMVRTSAFWITNKPTHRNTARDHEDLPQVEAKTFHLALCVPHRQERETVKTPSEQQQDAQQGHEHRVADASHQDGHDCSQSQKRSVRRANSLPKVVRSEGHRAAFSPSVRRWFPGFVSAPSSKSPPPSAFASTSGLRGAQNRFAPASSKRGRQTVRVECR